jgi:signal transduction histidine kinase
LLSHVGSVEIAITHTGRGIPPEAQPRIFERFTA